MLENKENEFVKMKKKLDKRTKQGKSTCTKLLWMLQKNTEVTTDVGFKTITKYNDSLKCKIKKFEGEIKFF